jgi:hypothetical protein
VGVTYEQAILGLFTAGTSVAPDLRKAGEGQLKEKVGCKRGIEDVDRCHTPSGKSMFCLIPDGIKLLKK